MLEMLINWYKLHMISDYESDFDSDGEDENEIFDMIAKY